MMTSVSLLRTPTGRGSLLFESGSIYVVSFYLIVIIVIIIIVIIVIIVVVIIISNQQLRN